MGQRLCVSKLWKASSRSNSASHYCRWFTSRIAGMFDIKDARVMTSTEALALQDIPKKLLVVGGGYIGMELGTVYARLAVKSRSLSARRILLGADADLCGWSRSAP